MAKSELEELGGEFEDLVGEGFSKYRKELMALTNVDGTGGVDILADEATNTYKNVYEIFVELSKVWGQLSDTSQARVAEILGGSRQLSVISSLMTNISDATNAYADAMNSAGVAAEANSTVMDTTAKRMEILRTSFETLSRDVINSDLTKGIVDFGTSAVDWLDKVINKVGALPVALGALTGLEVIKNLGDIFTAITGVGQLTGLGKSLAEVDEGLGAIGVAGSTAIPVLAAVVAAVVAAVAIYDKLVVSFDEAAAKANESANAYNSTKAELDSMNAELETTQARIAELEAMDSLTFTEEQELANLKAQNELLESQIVLRERIASAQNKVAVNDAYEALTTKGASLASDGTTYQAGSWGELWYNLTHTRTSGGLYGSGGDVVGELQRVDIIDLISAKQQRLNDLTEEYNGFATDKRKVEIDAERAKLLEEISGDYDIIAGLVATIEGKEGPLTERDVDLLDRARKALFEIDSANGVFAGPEKRIGQTKDELEAVTEAAERAQQAVAAVASTFSNDAFGGKVGQLFRQGNWMQDVFGNGNVDLRIRPQIDNGDGSYSTVASQWANEFIGDQEAAIHITPITPDGEFLDQDTIDSYISELFDGAQSAWDVLQRDMVENGGLGLILRINPNYDESLFDFENGWDDYLHECQEIYYNGIQELQDALDADNIDISISDLLQEGFEGAAKGIDFEHIFDAHKIKSTFDSMWDSDNFKDTKESLEAFSKSLMGLSGDQIESLAESSEELNAILQTDGMSAEFLANVIQSELTGGAGFDMVTADALQLNDALDLLTGKLDAVSEAIAKYNVATSSEKNDNFESYSEAWTKFFDEVEAGTTNSNQFWASAELLLGAEYLEKIGYNADTAVSSMKNLGTAFADSESNGTGLLLMLEKMANSEGEVRDASGELLATISRTGDEWDFQIEPDKFHELAQAIGITDDALTSLLRGIEMYGNIDWSDTTKAVDSLSSLGLAADTAGQKVINWSATEDYLTTVLGKTNKEVWDFQQALLALDDVTLLDLNGEISETISQLEELEIASNIDGNVTINVDDLGGLLADLGYTKSTADELLGKLAEVDGVTLTNANGQVLTLEEACDRVSEKNFDTPKEGADDLGGAASSAKDNVDDLNKSSTEHLTSQLSGSASQAWNLQSGLVMAKSAAQSLNGTTATVTTIQRTVYTSEGSSSSSSGGGGGGTKTRQVSANGTAHALGTALASGDWGTAKGGKTLVGELGPELLVDLRSGTWKTVGDHGAEFVDIPSGSIVFNHLQTQDLLKHGYINSRGLSLATGTAMGIGGKITIPSSALPKKTSYSSPSTSNYSPTGSTDSTSSTTKDDKTAPWEEELKRYQHMRKMEQMSDDEYYNHLMALLDQYYSVRETYLDDYWSLEEEYYDLGKDLADDWFSDRQHDIDLLSHHRGTQNEQIAMYMEMQAEAHRLADEARARGLDDNDEYIQNLQKTWWDAADNIKDLIDQTYDEIESRLQNGIDLRQNWIDAQLNYGNFDKAQMYSMEAVQKYEEYQATLHERADYLRNERGLSDDDDEVAALSLEWWEVQRKKIEQQFMVSNAIIDYNNRLIDVNSRGLESAIANGQADVLVNSTDQIVTSYIKMQDQILAQEQYYRDLGYDDTSEAIMELEEKWYEYQEAICDAMTESFESLVGAANSAVDEIQNVYDTLINGAKEYAENGFITVDTFQQISNLGLQYMAMLQNENGQLVINKDNIHAVIAAKTEELAIDTALNYVRQIAAAVAAEDTIALQNLLYATNNATKGNWAFVYSQLAMIGLSGDQMRAAMSNLDAYYSLSQTAAASVGQTLADTSSSASEAAEALPQLSKDLFDELDDEVQFLLGLLEEQDELIRSWDKVLRDANGLVDEMNVASVGQLTDAGWATMGLYAQQYMTYMKMAEIYAEQRAEAEAKVASSPYNTNYLNELQEVTDKQREAIENQYKARDAIKDLVEDGIKAELEAVQNLIDIYENSLDSAKDLFSYQKKIQKQTKTISQLQKSINAYQGDDSEETRKTLYQLKDDLVNAQEELEETQYDKYVSDQKKLLSKLYDDYELTLNSRLDNVDALVEEVINNVVQNADQIWSTIESVANDVGYEISDSTTTIWQNLAMYGSGIIDTIGNGFSYMAGVVDGVTKTIDGAMQDIATAVAASQAAAAEKMSSALESLNLGGASSPDVDKDSLVRQSEIIAEMRENSDKWHKVNNDTSLSEPDKTNQKDALHNANKALVEELKKLTGRDIDINGAGHWYWKDTGAILYHDGGVVDGNTAQNEVWAKLLKGEVVLSHDQIRQFLDKNKMMNSMISTSSSNNSSAVTHNTFEVILPNVQNYEDFMHEMANDKRFKGFVQSVTTDLVAGRSEINKNRFSWR